MEQGARRRKGAEEGRGKEMERRGLAGKAAAKSCGIVKTAARLGAGLQEPVTCRFFEARFSPLSLSLLAMTTADALKLIRSQLERMNALYGRAVFDEWALLGLNARGEASVLGYEGPRAERFADELPRDAESLRTAQAKRDYGVGDFEFVHEEAGQGLDAFLRAGLAAYLVCNHTGKAMADIRREPRWRQAQVVWFNLAEKFRADPVMA